LLEETRRGDGWMGATASCISRQHSIAFGSVQAARTVDSLASGSSNHPLTVVFRHNSTDGKAPGNRPAILLLY